MTFGSSALSAIVIAGAIGGCMLAELPTGGFDACLVDRDCPAAEVCNSVAGVRECAAKDALGNEGEAPPAAGDDGRPGLHQGEGESEGEGEGEGSGGG